MTDGTSQASIHELVTLTRRLDTNEIKRLRARLTTAKISTTRLSISGDPDTLAIDLLDLLGAHFDVMISSRLDGFRRLALRLPPSMYESTMRRFTTGSLVELTRMGGAWILDMQVPARAFTPATNACEHGAQVEHDHDHDPGWLDALAPLHTAVSRGDLRPLYVAWLHGAMIELGDDELEPEVPAGLRAPSRALEALTVYLGVDPNLLSFAAKSSPPMLPELSGLTRWIQMLPPDEKDDLLLRFVEGDAALASTIVRRFREENAWLSTTALPRARASRASTGEGAPGVHSNESSASGSRTVSALRERLRLLMGAARSK